MSAGRHPEPTARAARNGGAARRRRRRGGRREEGASDAIPGLASAPEPAPAEAVPSGAPAVAEQSAQADEETEDHPGTLEGDQADTPDRDDAAARGRRRGRRGGRRRRRTGEEDISPVAELGAEQPEVPAVAYQGPTPANPFGSQAYDIFDVIEQAEQIRPEAPPSSAPLPESEQAPAAADISASSAPEPEPPVPGEAAPEPPPMPSAPELARGMDVIDAAEPAAVPHPARGAAARAEAERAEPAPEPPPAAAGQTISRAA